MANPPPDAKGTWLGLGVSALCSNSAAQVHIVWEISGQDGHPEGEFWPRPKAATGI